MDSAKRCAILSQNVTKKKNKKKKHVKLTSKNPFAKQKCRKYILKKSFLTHVLHRGTHLLLAYWAARLLPVKSSILMID